MSDKTKWRHKQVVPKEMPDEYKRHTLEQSRREVGMKLYSILEQNINPAVVEINEHIVITEKYDDMDEIIIDVSITPVAHRNVEIMRGEILAYPIRKLTFIQRLRYLLTGARKD